MADVNLEIELDQQGLRQETRRAERTLEQMEKRLSRKRARARLRRIRADRRAEQRITREREREEQARLTMERRLSRRRARNRLRQIRERRRQEARVEREAERERERRRERRRRIARGAVGFAGRGAAGVGFGVAGAAAGTLGAFFDSDQILEFGRALALLAGQAGITRKEQSALAEAMTDVSIQTSVARTDVLRGFQAIIEKSGNLTLASDVLLDMSKASVGLNTDMEDLGLLAAALGQSFNASGKDVVKFFELLAAQGDKGEVSLENLASIGADVFSKAAAFGVKGEAGIGGVGAILQTTPLASVDERKTSVGNFLQKLGTKGKDIKRLFGVSTTDKSGELRNPAQLLKEIIRSTGGNLGQIEKVFTDTSLNPFLLSAKQYQDTNRFDKLNEFLALGAGSSGLIDKRFRRVESTADVIALEKISNIVTQLSDKALGPALGAISKSLEELLELDMEGLANGFAVLGKGLGALTTFLLELVSQLGGVAKVFGFDINKKPEKRIRKQLTPDQKKKLRDAAGGVGENTSNMKLNVTTNVAVDDRGNPKKSRTRVDAQNDSNVGRTLGATSNE